MTILACSACGVSGVLSGTDPGLRPLYYQVQSGDSVESIASKYRVSARNLKLLNGLRSEEDLIPGSKLLVRYLSPFDDPVKAAKGGAPFATKTTSPQPPGTVEAKTAPLGWPLAVRGVLTSKFGSRWGRKHEGVDLSAKPGTPILAAHDARVVYADDRISGYGNMVVLKDKRKFLTVYGHNRKLLVEVGNVVRRGDTIAELGSTGRSTGPHLHFEVRLPNSSGKGVHAVDPLPYIYPEANK